MPVRHGAIALNVPDDPAGRVPNPDAPPVARVIQVFVTDPGRQALREMLAIDLPF